jgi:KaiC/GvpD/RAD55 family RecA-like ATPase
MAKVLSGIPGLDELINGGFLEGSSVLVCGGSGTGKTIAALQYLYKGMEQYGEPGIYISLEEGATNLWWIMKAFQWNITKYEQQNKIKLYRIGLIEPADFAKKFPLEIEKIKSMVEEFGAKRLVIDSTTAFAMWMPTESQIRYSLFRLVDELKEAKCTTVMTAETFGKRDQFSRFGVEEFVSDAVIALYLKPPQRAIFIRKMRGSKHDQKIHPFTIDEKGFTVFPKEEILWESLRD